MPSTSALGGFVRSLFQSGSLNVFSKCILAEREMRKLAFWNAIEVFDIILDITMVVLPTILLYQVQISWDKKVMILSAFAARLL